ncbi:hypothetical protein A2Y83_02685 [Candidatus Falkowbacteria bacterium RBG_13_39_14]|uniref:DUF4012 domain-containing protein n=1 Tax=Candidatus Falkowbacteria bacterium RBG_13_39_14 TaxID=1797985 RepID=A0A1F5S2H7_9BACT|nr:MAG: hypothetical protein A2Y83_02685 [Candidatus Falkowbacteria bacterium RBG_13_39_14]
MFDIPQEPRSNKEKIKQIGKKIYDASKKRRDGRKVHKIVQYALYFFTVLFLLAAINFAAYPSYLKYIYSQLAIGKDSIENTMAHVMEEDFNKAFAWANLAKHNFSNGFEKFKMMKDNFFVSNIKPLNNQLADIERVLKSTETLSGAVQKATAIGKEMEDAIDEGNMVSFSKFTLDEKRRILKVIEKKEKDFENIKLEMDIAADNLNEVEYYAALEPFKDLIDGLKIRVTKERDTFAKALPMLKIMPGFFGYPEGARYIAAVYEPASESRRQLPPEGRTGELSPASENTKNTKIDEFFIFDILYGEILGCEAHNVNEPGNYEPIKQWLREDGDFDFEWDELARNINRYYPAHSGFVREFDGIISGSPKFIREFFELSGQIIINGTEYNKDNIFKQIDAGQWDTQLQVKQEDKCPLFLELKIRIFDLPPLQWADFVDIVHENTETKNINATLKNQKVQELIRGQQAKRGL